MAKVILSIRKRNLTFVTKEAECISRWESWRYMIWVLRDVRENPKKWKVYSSPNVSWISDTNNPYVARTVLGSFLRILMVANKLEFEDTVYVLKHNLQAELIHETGDRELNKLSNTRTKDSYDWNLDVLVKTKARKGSKSQLKLTERIQKNECE